MRVFLRTFGCRANQYDSETVRAMVERGGGTVVATPEQADMAVFNSCAVTAAAETDLRKAVRMVARRRPRIRSVVMGCAASLRGEALLDLPGVSAVVPGADFAGVGAALALGPGALGPAAGQGGTRALLRVQDGCNEHCTFCATTLARGPNRSRGVPELVEEAQRLSRQHPEIVLTGVHIGTYGHDTGTSLGLLVERLVRDVPDARFRLTSVEATEVDERLRDLFTDSRRLVPHLHAPLQSGSDRVLRRMGRHWYSASTYARAVERVVAAQPSFALGADVIAGFPGETAGDHAATVALVGDLPFTYLHVFPYSERPGTAAVHLGPAVERTAVEARSRELRELGVRRAASYARSRIGGLADVVVLGGGRHEGLTEDYLVVRLQDGVAQRGQRLDARLSGDAAALRAQPVEPVMP